MDNLNPNYLSSDIIFHGYSLISPNDLLKTIETYGDISKLPGDLVIVNTKKNYAVSSF